MAPGVLPLISSCFEEVTSASATSALVSDMRVIGAPTSSTVDCPTMTSTELVASSGAPGAGAAAAAGSVDVPLSEAAKPAQRRDAATPQREVQPSPAPPSRGNGASRTVRLSPEQQEAAKISGLSNEEYARNLVAEKSRNTTH